MSCSGASASACAASQKRRSIRRWSGDRGGGFGLRRRLWGWEAAPWASECTAFGGEVP